ncbi:ankyrin repeat domain-containing protein 13C-B-like isoform X2 [Xenia sp. Carnegie-2017]|uniref:ankyrin repeat domain-containing protein 13C-B-like isoform X2 n=1 Tax=Xenia sp. Carnegie-2017 TaxID=2897299 RepID=UPI001F0485EB|nr:ankyrin repeat domain-containing protein 13C-B-like isoform X2 [Xenia sp. Carnegie-2017]
MSESTTVCDQYPLHRAVFEGNLRKVSSLLHDHDIDERDSHGNTPLHLAVMLGHKECVYLLLEKNATIKVKNASGWSPLAEAISWGSRSIVKAVLRKMKEQNQHNIERNRPKLMKALHGLGDFYVELKWDFTSWIPLVSRILPSDTCKISKKGCCIRLDSTLIDFADMKWQRGDISIIFNGDAEGTKSFAILDNEKKVFQRMQDEDSDAEVDEEVDLLMSCDIVSAMMSTKPITFSRSQDGWFFKEDKIENVGSYVANVYDVNGMTLITKKRREHLSKEDIVKNKVKRKKSLSAPAVERCSWEKYIDSETINMPTLGRKTIFKEEKKTMKATVAMNEGFPLKLEPLLNVLEVIAPFKHFDKLKDFVSLKLPPGFPVRVEIPVLPTIVARITFQKFEAEVKIPDSKFLIPKDFKEDPCRFPDL